MFDHLKNVGVCVIIQTVLVYVDHSSSAGVCLLIQRVMVYVWSFVTVEKLIAEADNQHYALNIRD